jgi:hypothetical protein
MWVEVLSIDADGYIGRLDNDPTLVTELHADDRIRFRPEHVAALWRYVPDAPTPDQFVVVSERVWHEGAFSGTSDSDAATG